MQTKFKQLAGVLVLAMGGLAAGNASAVTLVDTTGLPGIGYQEFSAGESLAALFSTGSSCPLGCTLGTISLRLTIQNGEDPLGPSFSNFKLSIYSNTGGNEVGSLLTSTGDILNPGTDISFSNPSYTAYEFTPTPTANIPLENNSSYWVALTNYSDTVLRWETVGVGTRRQSLFEGDGFNIVPVNSLFGGHSFSVEATAAAPSAVPIPGAVWLMGSALVGFVGWGRRLQV